MEVISAGPVEKRMLIGNWWRGLVIALATCLMPGDAGAQSPLPQTTTGPATSGGWQTSPPQPQNTTTITRPNASTDAQAGQQVSAAVLTTSAVLTTEGRRIDQGIVWRVYEDSGNAGTPPRLVATERAARPTFKLKPGRYLVNAAFGKAYLTRPVQLESGDTVSETFVLNAGGLKLHAYLADGKTPVKAGVTFDIYTDERNLIGERARIVTGTRPGLILRLNAGIYHVISRYGDANAVVSADVTVEAGKLTEAAINHRAGRVTFKLVQRKGGEALANTRWSIATNDGSLVKQSAGALPSHILEEGAYVATAQYGGRTYQSAFRTEAGKSMVIELVTRE